MKNCLIMLAIAGSILSLSLSAGQIPIKNNSTHTLQIKLDPVTKNELIQLYKSLGATLKPGPVDLEIDPGFADLLFYADANPTVEISSPNWLWRTIKLADLIKKAAEEKASHPGQTAYLSVGTTGLGAWNVQLAWASSDEDIPVKRAKK
jgi:hypothetical protein